LFAGIPDDVNRNGHPFMRIVRQQPCQDPTRRSRTPQIEQMAMEFTQHKGRAQKSAAASAKPPRGIAGAHMVLITRVTQGQ
jgi:hypothetical protein